MRRFFGSSSHKNEKKKSKRPVPLDETNQAIQELRNTEDLMVKKQEYLETKIQNELEKAKANAKTNKKVAIQALKRKKRYEMEMEKNEGVLATLEQQRVTLENANTNTAIFNNMGQAAQAMKNAHRGMDVDKVHDLMDDIAEQHQVAEEITNAITNPVGITQEFDEDDLEAELAELGIEEEQKNLDEQLLSVNLPNVPQTELKTPSNKVEKDEMAELAEWAS